MTTAAVIYARYSTDRQDACSIDDQLRRCREFAERSGFEVVAEFADAAISGAHTERAQLRRMLDLATSLKRSPFRAVIVDDLSRLSRDIGDTHALVFKDLAGAGVKVLDTTGLDSEADSGEMTVAMRSIINREYIRGVSKQTHRGLTGRAIAGYSTGGSLYGYRTHAEVNPSDVEHPRKLWAIDDVEGAIVRRIFDEYDRGAASYKAIAERLNAEGVRAPRDGRRGHKSGLGWGHTSVRAVLRNAKYRGTWVWNMTKWTRSSGKSTRRDRPESEHVTREHPELAMIERATWDRVQARIARTHPLDKSGTRRGRPPGTGKRPYLVSGLLRCGMCGGSMSICSQKTKAGVRYANFGCTAHRSRGAAICANSTTVSERKITGALLDALRDALTSPELLDVFARAFDRRVRERASTERPADLERTLRAAQTRVTNATRLIVEMPDDLDLRRQREADKAEVQRLTGAISELARAAPSAVPDGRAVRAAMTGFLDVLASAAPEAGREALARVMAPLVLTPKVEEPGNVIHVSGSIDLAALTANCSSGGRI